MAKTKDLAIFPSSLGWNCRNLYYLQFHVPKNLENSRVSIGEFSRPRRGPRRSRPKGRPAGALAARSRPLYGRRRSPTATSNKCADGAACSIGAGGGGGGTAMGISTSIKCRRLYAPVSSGCASRGAYGTPSTRSHRGIPARQPTIAGARGRSMAATVVQRDGPQRGRRRSRCRSHQ